MINFVIFNITYIYNVPIMYIMHGLKYQHIINQK